jgi:hypothetical protein
MADKLQDGRPKCGASLELPSGFVKTEEGEVVIPSSRRADGSMRKPIRIRQGYIPQDEIPKYKTVAQRVSSSYTIFYVFYFIYSFHLSAS